MHYNAKDLTGKKFGRLSVIVYAYSKKPHGCYWLCKCDCENKTIVLAYALTSGNTKSCGCLHKEIMSKLNKGRTGAKHYSFKHGLINTPEYNAWSVMFKRCGNPNRKDYKLYGGRGITVCERWSDFLVFLGDMGAKPTDKHSIDRIDNNGNYEPLNCRWATSKEQANNRSTNINLSYEGLNLTIAAWADKIGINRTTLYARYHRGWTTERILKEYKGDSIERD